jgi:hypothetical protein
MISEDLPLMVRENQRFLFFLEIYVIHLNYSIFKCKELLILENVPNEI